MGQRRRISLVATVGILATLVVPPPATAQPASALDLLGLLATAPENTSAYSRDAFRHWVDADGNGCDTRAEVLIMESAVPTTGGCPVKGGRWTSYYDGASWTEASKVQIDHMVPLSEAWDSGAHLWTADQRRDFANDLGYGPSLVAVTSGVNQSKGDRDPAQWLPPSSAATCRYVGEWVAVKYRWGLTVDQAERTTLTSLLQGSCAGTMVEMPQLASTASTPATTNPGATERYITRVYGHLFDRAPDPQGLATWTARLQAGTPYGEVANGITYSAEYRSRMIRDTYRTYLDREAEPAGLASWLAAMQAGQHIEQMQAGFISSPEYYGLGGGTDSGWIVRLYEKVLHRTPAPSEVQHWLGRLAAGASRYDVAIGFLYSTEHLTEVVDGYYQLLLGRSIDPSGRATWVGLIQRGARDEEIIASIVSSAEYRAKP
jgi:hypothetical protein